MFRRQYEIQLIPQLLVGTILVFQKLVYAVRNNSCLRKVVFH